MMKKKKQSRSQSSTKKTLEPFLDSSPSPRLLSIIRSKLASGKDLKHMFRGMRSKTVPGLSSQSRIVRCPKCHKLLQEPLDATSYKCGGCESILHAKRWELEGTDNTDTIPEALFSSQNRSLSTEAESAEGGSRTPMRSTQREYNSRASPSVEKGHHSETVYKHETSDIRREWMRRMDEFSDSDAFASARSSPYNSRSNASHWTQHDGRYEDPPQVPFYPASPSPSSAYEYGYSSPFHGSHVSASEQSYYHHQTNQFKQHGREGWLQESSAASPAHFPGETSDGKYYHRSSQSQLHDLQYRNLYESSSSATPHRSVYSEYNYQAAAAPHRSTYSEYSVGSSKSETSSEKRSQRDKKRYVKERNPVVKRHILPSAGGAPFATCSYCLELLQLPQVSPNGKHKRYQVRCGSCSGVLKFSIRETRDTVLDSPSIVDSGMGLADETVTNHQDFEENYPDESHLPCLDDDFGDTICQSTNAVILSRSLETFEDYGIKKDERIISSKTLDSKSKALPPRLKPLMNHRLREQQPASNETIRETSRIHLEQSQEAYSEKSTEMDNDICERIGCNLEESEYKKNELTKPEEIVGEGSCEEVERVAERPVSHSVEPLYKNVYVCETRIPSEDTRDTHEFDWEEAQENEEYGGGSTSEEIMGDRSGLHLEKSRYIGVSLCDSNSSYGEKFEDAAVEEGTKHIANTFSDAISATPQSPLKYMVNENPIFIGHPDQSGGATFTVSTIYEEQSKYEYENLRERQELDKKTSDRVRYEVESRYETNETLEPGKVGEDAYVVSHEKASKTFKTIIEGERGEERSVSQNVDSPDENIKNSCETLEPIYLEGSGYAGERTWEETMGDRAGLHLEEYESNYESYSKLSEWTSERAPTSGMHDYELGAMLESDEDADGISESSSRGSFNDHGSSEERFGLPEPPDAKPDQAQYKYESSSERKNLSNTVFDIVRSDLQEFRYETDETLVPSKMVGDGSVESVEKAGVTIISEICEESLVSHQMEPENENIENSYGTVEPVNLEESRCESENPWAETLGDGAGLKLEVYNRNPVEWTSEIAPTFHLHEYELGTVPEAEEDATGRSIPSSPDFFNDHISLNEIDVYHKEEPWLVDENKIEALQLEKCKDESMKLEGALEWTSERAPTFRLREYELGAMLESDDDADGRSDSSSKNSFCDDRILKEREFLDEEEPQLVTDGRTEALQVGEMAKNIVSLHLEECGNESMKLDAFEWTSGRTLTFRRHGCEVGTKLEPDEDADGRSESSSRGSFTDRGSSRKIAVTHEVEPWLVDDYETKALKVGVMAEDGQSLHLEKCDNERMELDETLELRDDIFRLSLDDTLEQERMTFHSNMSQDKQDHLRLSFKQGDAEEDMPEFSSRVSLKSHESPSKMAEFNSAAEEKILKDHLEHFQEEKEKSGLTSESYAHIHSTTKPCEIVGLRHALYQTQSSPLRSPLTSPIRTPVGSPLHYMMASQIRSPIASPMHSHIVSPLRSPINSSGSLSDVLFFGKKTDKHSS